MIIDTFNSMCAYVGANTNTCTLSNQWLTHAVVSHVIPKTAIPRAYTVLECVSNKIPRIVRTMQCKISRISHSTSMRNQSIVVCKWNVLEHRLETMAEWTGILVFRAIKYTSIQKWYLLIYQLWLNLK